MSTPNGLACEDLPRGLFDVQDPFLMVLKRLKKVQKKLSKTTLNKLSLMRFCAQIVPQDDGFQGS